MAARRTRHHQGKTVPTIQCLLDALRDCSTLARAGLNDEADLSDSDDDDKHRRLVESREAAMRAKAAAEAVARQAG